MAKEAGFVKEPKSAISKTRKEKRTKDGTVEGSEKKIGNG